MRLIDSCITQLKAKGPSRTCNKSKEEEDERAVGMELGVRGLQAPSESALTESYSRSFPLPHRRTVAFLRLSTKTQTSVEMTGTAALALLGTNMAHIRQLRPG